MRSLGGIAASYAEKLGFSVFPLLEKSKLPATKNGFKDATKDLPTIKTWWDKCEYYNIGLKCGLESGLWVLDVDGEQGRLDLDELELKHGNLPKTPVQLTANGKHYLFRYPIGITIGNKAKLIRHDAPGGLDVRGEGGYIVLSPSIHPTSGKPYTWLVKPSECPLADAPEWLLSLVVKQSEALAAPLNGQRKVFNPPSRIRRSTSPEAIINDQLAMVATAPEGARNHTLNVAAMKVGKVISHADMSESLAKKSLMAAALQVGLDPHEIDATINSGLNYGKTQPYEYGSKKNPEPSINHTNLKLEYVDSYGVIHENNKDFNKEVINKFKLFSHNDLLYSPKVEWIIKDVFPKKSFGVIYGIPGKGKTFVALDMALCIAHGLQWHGLDVVQGSVLYIAGEGIGGLPKRLKAWKAQYAPPNETPPFYAIAANVNMRESNDVNAIIATIDGIGQKFSLVVIDTVARAILGGDENSATDMGLFVAACDFIKDHTGAAVIGVHHSGKDEEKGMRGSSALLGAVDTVVLVSQDQEGTIILKNQKQKDAELFKDMVFQTAVIATGINETSLIIEPSEKSPIYQKKGIGRLDMGLQFLRDCIISDTKKWNNCPATDIQKWRSMCDSRELGGDTPAGKRMAFKRCFEKLQGQGIIAAENGLVWIANEPE